MQARGMADLYARTPQRRSRVRLPDLKATTTTTRATQALYQAREVFAD
jgi:hypothetical protein